MNFFANFKHGNSCDETKKQNTLNTTAVPEKKCKKAKWLSEEAL